MASAVDIQPQTTLKSELQCVFCQATIPSSEMLTEHLMLCGNKTEQCPNCEKFIRRAIFAYHYENRCANIDEPDVKPTTTTNNSVQLRTYQLEKPSAPKISQRHSLDIVECEFCKQKCARNDCQTHKDNCLKNPEKNKPNQRDLPTTESTDVTYIPCEYCQQQIDFNQFSTHTKECQQKEARRLQTRAETINREPGIERIECAYCKEPQSLHRLHGHELICEKNPRNERPLRSRVASLISTLPSFSIPSYRTVLNSTDRLSSIRNKSDELRETEKQRLLSSHVKANLEQPVDIPEPQRESSSSLINSDYRNSERGRASTSSHSNVERLSSQWERRSTATSLDRRPREHERDLPPTRTTTSISHNSRAHSATRVCSTETHVTSRYQLARPTVNTSTYHSQTSKPTSMNLPKKPWK